MKKLVEEMLTLFRAESVRRETAFSEVDLSDVVTDAALRFEPVVFESGRRLLYTIDEGLQVSGDRDALERLTGILLDNAVKYAPQGTDIRLTLTHQDRTACLTVETAATHPTGGGGPPVRPGSTGPTAAAPARASGWDWPLHGPSPRITRGISPAAARRA